MHQTRTSSRNCCRLIFSLTDLVHSPSHGFPEFTRSQMFHRSSSFKHVYSSFSHRYPRQVNTVHGHNSPRHPTPFPSLPLLFHQPGTSTSRVQNIETKICLLFDPLTYARTQLVLCLRILMSWVYCLILRKQDARMCTFSSINTSAPNLADTSVLLTFLSSCPSGMCTSTIYALITHTPRDKHTVLGYVRLQYGLERLSALLVSG